MTIDNAAPDAAPKAETTADKSNVEATPVVKKRAVRTRKPVSSDTTADSSDSSSDEKVVKKVARKTATKKSAKKVVRKSAVKTEVKTEVETPSDSNQEAVIKTVADAKESTPVNELSTSENSDKVESDKANNDSKNTATSEKSAENNENKDDRENRHRNNNNNNRNNRNNNRNNRNKKNNRRFRLNDEEIQAPAPDPEKLAQAKQNWKDMREKNMNELQKLALDLEIPETKRLRKQALLYRLLEATAGEELPIYAEGVLEVLHEGYGFLRSPDHCYLAGPDDIYMSPAQIKRFELKTGDTIQGQVRAPRNNEKYFALTRVDTVNFDTIEVAKRRVAFEHLTPLHPEERFNLEWNSTEYASRIMNLFTPIGKGQRSIILAPPRTGKTVLLQNLANAITQNHPEVQLMVLLIDERPEEVTDMSRNVKGEVLSSTFDEPPERHVAVADMALEKAKRLVEHGQDVVILLDSITRFARANNVVIPHSGKILSGGVDAKAMQRPKRFFGAARNIENGGSLTIIGTALVETGSRMDEVIFEEFKGTGNMELVLDRRIAEKRVWPAIDIFKSGTRKEELLIEDEELRRIWILRRFLQDQTPLEIVEFFRDKFAKAKTNADFLASMNG